MKNFMIPITILPTTSLHRASRSVLIGELEMPEIQQVISEMIPTMYDAQGIGIAAPQVAVPKERYLKTIGEPLPDPAIVRTQLSTPLYGFNARICVIGKDAIPEKFFSSPKTRHMVSPHTDLILINPSCEKTSKKTITESEGCLSVIGQSGDVKRFKDIHVEAFNEHGDKLSFDASGYFARVIQHEIDHLNGVLFVDRAHTLYKQPTS